MCLEPLVPQLKNICYVECGSVVHQMCHNDFLEMNTESARRGLCPVCGGKNKDVIPLKYHELEAGAEDEIPPHLMLKEHHMTATKHEKQRITDLEYQVECERLVKELVRVENDELRRDNELKKFETVALKEKLNKEHEQLEMVTVAKNRVENENEVMRRENEGLRVRLNVEAFETRQARLYIRILQQSLARATHDKRRFERYYKRGLRRS